MILFMKRGEPAETINYIDYIESTGSQYIDTGFTPNSNTRVVLNCQINYVSGIQPIFGARDINSNNGEGSNSFVLLAFNGQLRSDYGSLATIINITPNNVFNIDKNKNHTIINNTSYDVETEHFVTSHSLAIFTLIQPDGIDNRMISMKLYGMKIYDNENLVRDYLPCLDKNNVACLFDRIAYDYVYNDGNGEFLYG